MAFTAEEVWQQRDEFVNEYESVHLAKWPETKPKYIDKSLDETWEKIIEVRREVSKSIEKLREQKIIGNSLQVEVTIYADSELISLLTSYQDQLASIFIVSEVRLEEYNPSLFSDDVEISLPERLAIHCSRSDNQKCERCWNYFSSVGKIEEHSALCHRCAQAVNEIIKQGNS